MYAIFHDIFKIIICCHTYWTEMSFNCHVVDAQHLAKYEVVTSKHQVQEERAVTIYNLLSPDLQRTVSLSSEKGASSWNFLQKVEDLMQTSVQKCGNFN